MIIRIIGVRITWLFELWEFGLHDYSNYRSSNYMIIRIMGVRITWLLEL